MQGSWVHCDILSSSYGKGYKPLLVSTTKPGQNHLSEAAGPIQFWLTFGPLDGTLQSSIEEALKIQHGTISRGNMLTIKNVKILSQKHFFFSVSLCFHVCCTHRLSEGLWGGIGRRFHA